MPIDDYGDTFLPEDNAIAAFVEQLAAAIAAQAESGGGKDG